MKGDCIPVNNEKSNVTRMFLLKVIDTELIASNKKVSVFHHHRSNTNFIINFKENFCSGPSPVSHNNTLKTMQSFPNSNKNLSHYSESNISKISTSLTLNQALNERELSSEGISLLRKYCCSLKMRKAKKVSDLGMDRKVRNYMTQILDEHFLRELKLLVAINIPQKKKISFNY